MDSHFLDDCGLDEPELDEIQRDYFLTSNRGLEMPELSNSSESEVSKGEVNESDALPVSSTDFETNQDNDDFSSQIKNFLERSCGCHYGKNQGPCSSSFDFEQLFEHRIQCTELSSTELDLVVQGALASHLNFSSGKKRCRMNYFFRGQQVCKNTFMFVFLHWRKTIEKLKEPS